MKSLLKLVVITSLLTGMGRCAGAQSEPYDRNVPVRSNGDNMTGYYDSQTETYQRTATPARNVSQNGPLHLYSSSPSGGRLIRQTPYNYGTAATSRPYSGSSYTASAPSPGRAASTSSYRTYNPETRRYTYPPRSAMLNYKSPRSPEAAPTPAPRSYPPRTTYSGQPPVRTSQDDRGFPPRPTGALYRVFVGPFRSRLDAEDARQPLVARGIRPYIARGQDGYRVQCGAFEDRYNAEDFAQDLQADGIDCLIEAR